MASTVWRGHLTFGLISIPVRLFRGARAERIPLRRVARVRHEVFEEGAGPRMVPDPNRRKLTLAAGDQLPGWRLEPTDSALDNSEAFLHGLEASSQLVAVRQGSAIRETNSIVPESAITTGVEVGKGNFVEIPAEELKSLKAATSPDMAIQEFVALSEIDPVYFETSYYVVPEEVGRKAYALLYQALVNTNVVALAQVSMHGRDHVTVIRPGQTGLVAHTMFYLSEVHLDEQFTVDQSSVSAKELDLAGMLVKSLTTTFVPEKYKNGYQAKLQQLVAGKVSDSADESKPAASRLSEVVDIADALRRSLAQLKKPAKPSEVTALQERLITRAKKVGRTGA